MTTIIDNDASAISQGTTPTTGNSGGGSGTAWDAVAFGGNSTCISDNAHPLSSAFNAQAYKIASTTSNSATLNWGAAMGTKTTVWWRLYCYFTANPTNLHRLWTFFNGGTGGSVAGAMEITTGGKLDLRAGASGLANSTSKPSIPLNSWFRIEGFVTGSATVGQLEYKLFLSADSTVADWITTSAATLNTIGTLDFYKFGFSTAVANVGPYWMSGLGLSDTAYMGPNVRLAGPQLLVRAKSPNGSPVLSPGKVIPGKPATKPGKHSSNISMSATATAAVAVSAPAGTVVITGGDKTLSGPVAAVSVAASAGGWAVSVHGALGAVAVSAPAGTAVVLSRRRRWLPSAVAARGGRLGSLGPRSARHGCRRCSRRDAGSNGSRSGRIRRGDRSGRNRHRRDSRRARSRSRIGPGRRLGRLRTGRSRGRLRCRPAGGRLDSHRRTGRGRRRRRIGSGRNRRRHRSLARQRPWQCPRPQAPSRDHSPARSLRWP